jgi:predicted dehydrogenase
VKQVAQRPRDGYIAVRDVPSPGLRPGWILVENRYSLISAGTERSKIELGSKNLMQKARSRPDLARKVADKARVEGVRAAVRIARERLETLRPLGYCSAGVVTRVGSGVDGVAPGDRVACGGEWANHAELVAVPRNLVAKVPDGVALDQAVYATMGAIALHAVRQAEVTIGERVGVIGLGLVGQLAVRILHAAGCEAVGIDLDPVAVERAAAAGAVAYRRDLPGLQSAVLHASDGLGLDAILVCAATQSSDPLEIAARLARDRGRLVVVGDVPVAAPRALLYEKELDLRLSRSYGPGRYDRDYEERGRDLPAGYVRWTEQRNLQSFLELIAAGRLDPSPLTTHRFRVEQAADAYAVLAGEGDTRPFGILLEYVHAGPSAAEIPAATRRPRPRGAIRIGLIGAGAFARGTLVPILMEEGAELAAVASERGLSAADVASRFGFERVAESPSAVLEDEHIDAVVIATRHASHAALTAAALEAGKAVFVEKPLAIAEDELDPVEAALSSGGVLAVGFNRRFAALTSRLIREVPGEFAATLVARVNAGPLEATHWLNDPEEGGGRLLGEGCHFVDLLMHIAGSRVASAYAVAVSEMDKTIESSESIVGTLRFTNGAVGTLVYTGAGDTRLPKERIEAFGGGVSAVIDDFRRLELYSNGKKAVVRQKQDKGHRALLSHFLKVAAGQAEPMPADSYLASTRATLAMAESLRTGVPVEPV